MRRDLPIHARATRCLADRTTTTATSSTHRNLLIRHSAAASPMQRPPTSQRDVCCNLAKTETKALPDSRRCASRDLLTPHAHGRAYPWADAEQHASPMSNHVWHVHVHVLVYGCEGEGEGESGRAPL
ncbi:hypothetical protein ACJQWK_11309 [Exserohilum turcicum]